MLQFALFANTQSTTMQHRSKEYYDFVPFQFIKDEFFISDHDKKESFCLLFTAIATTTFTQKIVTREGCWDSRLHTYVQFGNEKIAPVRITTCRCECRESIDKE